MADKKSTGKSAAGRTEKKGNQILKFVLITVLAMCICVVSVLIVAFALITEGTYEMPEEPQLSHTQVADDVNGIIGYLSGLNKEAGDASKVKLNSHTDISIENIEVSSENTSETDTALLNFIKNDISSFIDSQLPDDYTGSFGESYKNMPQFNIAKKDVENAVCNVGAVDAETGEQKVDENGKVIDSQFYFITIDCSDTDKISSLFDTSADAKALEALRENVSSVLGYKKGTFDCEMKQITAKVNRLTDRISYIEFIEKYNVVLKNVTFKDKLSIFGEKDISFTLNIKKHFDYLYAGISFNSESLTVSPGSDDTSVSVNAVINDDCEYSVKFESSDENIVKIDDLGYITALSESEKPVTVKVTLDYLGNTYTDECLVYVRNPVEKIKISDDEISLGVGENFVLSAEIKPADATDKLVLWFTEDDDEGKIVTVDKNGKVTAVGEGQCKVVAVSDDGYFRDSCVVNVKGGGAGE